MGRGLTTLVLVVCLAGVVRAQDDPVRESRRYVQQALEAYKAKDYAAYLERMRRAQALRPGHPSLMYNLAGAYALVGNRGVARAWLARVAAMGLVYQPEKDSDFDAFKETAEFKALLTKFAANGAHVGRSAPAFTLAEKGLVTEGLAYDPVTATFYVGSIYRRKIVSVDARGAAKDFADERAGLWSVLGMKVDARRRRLWVTSSAQPQMAGFKEEENGRAAVCKFDLRTGRLLKTYTLPNAPARHALGDLAVNSRGDVFVTDSLQPAVYVIEHGEDKLKPFVEGAPFVSPQGLDFAPGERRLFVADYARGVYLLDLESRRATLLPAPPDAALLGIDGLYFYRGRLVGVQNGTNPQRVVQLFLGRALARVERLAVVEANNPLFDEPTLGVLVGGQFYYHANSQWGAVSNKGELAAPDKLRPHVVMKVRL
ncbi:MAG TPA: L-dopachrome tautomerase-related protein [Pyrinomonadaceae bacterium]